MVGASDCNDENLCKRGDKMRAHLRVLLTASFLTIALGVGLSGCASILKFTADTFEVDVVSQTVQQKAYKAASVAFTAWEGIQGSIKIYGRLAPCVTDGPIICRSSKAWNKIKAIELKTTNTLQAARPLIEAGSNDVDLLMSIPSVVYDAQTAFNEAKME